MFRAGALSLAVLVASCSDGGDNRSSVEPGPTQPTAPVADAGADAMVVDPVMPARPVSKKPGRPIEIVLRSSPGGARVSVDGTLLGKTPQVWLGETGGEHEFTFELEGHAMERFRFMPITTGILHPRLEPLAEETDAGVAPPPEVVPPQVPGPAPIVEDAPAAPLAPPLDAFAPLAPDASTAPPIGPTP